MTDPQPADTLTDEQIAELVRFADTDAEGTGYPLLASALRELQQRRAQDAQPQPASAEDAPLAAMIGNVLSVDGHILTGPQAADLVARIRQCGWQPASARPDVAWTCRICGPGVEVKWTGCGPLCSRCSSSLVSGVARVPAPAADIPVDAVNGAAALCESEARKFAGAVAPELQRTAKHWEDVATKLRGLAFSAAVAQDMEAARVPAPAASVRDAFFAGRAAYVTPRGWRFERQCAEENDDYAWDAYLAAPCPRDRSREVTEHKPDCASQRSIAGGPCDCRNLPCPACAEKDAELTSCKESRKSLESEVGELNAEIVILQREGAEKDARYDGVEDERKHAVECAEAADARATAAEQARDDERARCQATYKAQGDARADLQAKLAAAERREAEKDQRIHELEASINIQALCATCGHRAGYHDTDCDTHRCVVDDCECRWFVPLASPSTPSPLVASTYQGDDPELRAAAAHDAYVKNIYQPSTPSPAPPCPHAWEYAGEGRVVCKLCDMPKPSPAPTADDQ